MSVISTIIGGVFGAVIGSFCGVAVMRLGTQESVARGRSRCDRCRATVRWYDNVPLMSYILLRGRCRDCAARIPLWILGIEVVGAICGAILANVLAWATWTSAIGSTAIIALCIALVIIFFYDLRTMYIPLVPVYIAYGAVIVAAIYGVLPTDALLAERIIGALCGGGALFALAALSRERWMGRGDMHLGIIGGALFAVPGVLLWLTAAFGLGAIVGIALLASGRATRKSAMPFAPFLIAAMVLVAFAAHFAQESPWLQWYLG